MNSTRSEAPQRHARPRGDAAGLSGLVPRHWSRGEMPGSPAALETIARVAERIRSRRLADCNEAFAAVDACVTLVLTPAEALAHEQAGSRHLVSKHGVVTEVGPLARISDHDLRPAAAPRGGEHTRALLAELGRPAAEIEQLLGDGVVRQAR